MGHCNLCQAQRILQDCANISRWPYGNKSLGKHPSQNCGFRTQLFPSGCLRNFTVMARMKEVKNPTKKSKLQSKSLSVTSPPEGTSAPALSDVSLNSEDSSREMGFGGLSVLRKLPRKVLKLLSSIPLAIGELSVLSGLMALVVHTNPSLMRMNGTLNSHWILTKVKHRDFPRGHLSHYYSSSSALYYRVSSMVKPTLLATPFAKPSPSVAPYEPFIRKALKLIN